MRVLFASSEVFPLAKTGGLADVSGALPAALATVGVDVRVLTPAYRGCLDRLSEQRVIGDFSGLLGVAEVRLVEGHLAGFPAPLWLIDAPALFDRDGGPYQDSKGLDWADNPLRFGLFSWIAAHLAREGSAEGWRADVLHAHDWQSGLAAAYLRAWATPDHPGPATVFTIHNIAYQGNFPAQLLPSLEIPWDLYSPDGLEYWHQMSFLKSGLYFSDRITTVSPSYAREIQSAPHGSGMEGLLRHRASHLRGILNGADYSVWSPATDPNLPSPFDREDLEGKALAKAAVQRELGLAERADVPLFVIVSRLNWHKGMDLVLASIPALLRQGAQLALLGTGDKALEEGFRAAAAAHPTQIAARIGYAEDLAHRLIGGGDVLLMPSRSEPCGLTQFYAFRYGTLPLVQRVGGLADSVVDASFDALTARLADGFVFDEASTPALTWCIERACGLFRRKDKWRNLQDTALAQDFGWSASARAYLDLYRDVTEGKSA